MSRPGLRERMLKSRAAERFALTLGIDLRQYLLLLALFGTLSNRMEFLNMTFGLNKAAGGLVFVSLINSLFLVAVPPLAVYLLSSIAISMFMTFMVLFIDVGNSLMNPDEASVLAQQPIRGSTYVAAKVTRALTVIVFVITSLNAIPAVAGLCLRESRWFYPLTHLIAVYLAGLFVGFLVIGIYGWMFRFVSPVNIRNAVLWMQCGVMFLWLGSSGLMHMASAPVGILGRALKSSWAPWRWFTAVGLTGHAKYAGFSPWEAGAACLLSAAIIAIGLRAFRADYLMMASTLRQGGAVVSKRSGLRLWLVPLVRRMTGAPSGSGAFFWVKIMICRDWNFRMTALVSISGAGLMSLVALLGGIRVSPFAGKFTSVHFFPHCLGLVLAVTCKLMTYTAEPRGSVLFTMIPLGGLKPFVRGIFSSLWIPLAAVHLAVLCPCIFFWGAVDGVLFIGFSAAVVSCYLALSLFFIDGFPFASAFKPAIGKSMNAVFVIMLVPISIAAVIQWFCFRSVPLALGATVVVGISVCAVAYSSLRKLEDRIRLNLTILGFTPAAIFKEME